MTFDFTECKNERSQQNLIRDHSNAIIYGGEVTSVAQVQTNGWTEVKFPNGVSYMYK